MSLLTRRRALLSAKGKALLPKEYQQVEYLESTGRQYIDTKYVIGSHSKIEISCALLSDIQNVNTAIFGSSNVGSDYILLGTNSNIDGWIIQWGTFEAFGEKDNLTHTHIIDLSNKQYMLDDNYYSLLGLQQAYNTASAILCGVKRTNETVYRLSSVRIYNSKFYSNDILVRDFIPCYRKADNKAGMYDLVNGEFYTNKGTGEFILGGEV